eukprot:4196140-Prymnesium_polylepis.1
MSSRGVCDGSNEAGRAYQCLIAPPDTPLRRAAALPGRKPNKRRATGAGMGAERTFRSGY